MSILKKKEQVTMITPIPGFVPRQLAIDILHSHGEVITLNPLVLGYESARAPNDAISDEYYSAWYEITERIQYVPGLGRMGSGKISFYGCFHNMPWGLQTHIYAPMSTDLRYKYRIAGNQPGIEPPEPMEMGLAALGVPSDGLYLREDVEVKCNIAVMSFVKSQLKAASKMMVERIIKKAELVDAGVLHAMMENGKLRTVNPADRSSALPTSPTGSHSSTQRPLDHDTNHRQEQQQPSSPSLRPFSSAPGSPLMPYQVPRPRSFLPAYSPYADSAGTSCGYTVPGMSYSTCLGYCRHSMHPDDASYAGCPGDTYLHTQTAQLPDNNASPCACLAVGAPVEFPGDFHYPETGAPAPATSAKPTPRSSRNSDISSTRWSVLTDYTQVASQRNSPALSAVRSTLGSIRPLTTGKGAPAPFELSTHDETQEEYHAGALKELKRAKAAAE